MFNKNTTKLSCSCMPNIRSKINGHNKKRLQPKPREPQKLCNYLVKKDCPMNALCLTSDILYQTTIKCNDSKFKQKRYKGISKVAFKQRYANYKKSFKSKNDTALSAEYWTIEKNERPKTYMGDQRIVYQAVDCKIGCLLNWGFFSCYFTKPLNGALLVPFVQ